MALPKQQVYGDSGKRLGVSKAQFYSSAWFRFRRKEDGKWLALDGESLVDNDFWAYTGNAQQAEALMKKNPELSNPEKWTKMNVTKQLRSDAINNKAKVRQL